MVTRIGEVMQPHCACVWEDAPESPLERPCVGLAECTKSEGRGAEPGDPAAREYGRKRKVEQWMVCVSRPRRGWDGRQVYSAAPSPKHQRPATVNGTVGCEPLICIPDLCGVIHCR